MCSLLFQVRLTPWISNSLDLGRAGRRSCWKTLQFYRQIFLGSTKISLVPKNDSAFQEFNPVIIDNHKRSRTDHVQIYRILPELEQFCTIWWTCNRNLVHHNIYRSFEVHSILTEVLHRYVGIMLDIQLVLFIATCNRISCVVHEHTDYMFIIHVTEVHVSITGKWMFGVYPTSNVKLY